MKLQIIRITALSPLPILITKGAFSIICSIQKTPVCMRKVGFQSIFPLEHSAAVGTWESLRGVARHVAFQVGAVAKPDNGNCCSQALQKKNKYQRQQTMFILTTLYTSYLNISMIYTYYTHRLL